MIDTRFTCCFRPLTDIGVWNWLLNVCASLMMPLSPGCVLLLHLFLLPRYVFCYEMLLSCMSTSYYQHIHVMFVYELLTWTGVQANLNALKFYLLRFFTTHECFFWCTACCSFYSTVYSWNLLGIHKKLSFLCLNAGGFIFLDMRWVVCSMYRWAQGLYIFKMYACY